LTSLQRTDIGWWAGNYTTLTTRSGQSGGSAGPSVVVSASGGVTVNGQAVPTPKISNGILHGGGANAYPAVTLVMSLVTPVSGSTSGSRTGFSGTIRIDANTSYSVSGKAAPPADNAGQSDGSEALQIAKEVVDFVWNQLIGYVEGEIFGALLKALFQGLVRIYQGIVDSATENVLSAMRPALQALNKAKGSSSGSDEDGQDQGSESDGANGGDSASSDTSSGSGDGGTGSSSSGGDTAVDAGDAAADAGDAATVAEDVGTGAEILGDVGEAAEFLPLLLL
jgi:hypothetical protein